LFGIEVRQDLPVGEGLQDHCMTLMNWRADFESLMTALMPENIDLLQTEGRGPLSSNIAEAGGFIRTRPGLDAPDCQFHCAPVLFHEEGLCAAVEHGLAFGPGVVKPTSRGTVTLRTASPYVKPRIRHNYLTTEEDRATILARTKVALLIAQQDALNDIITGPFAAPDPDSTDEELWTYIEHQSMLDVPPDVELRHRSGRGLAPQGPWPHGPAGC
jgi:choline dehydrogenase